MLEQVGYFIGMAAADVAHFFRGRQAVPCLVEWDRSPFNEENWKPDVDPARFIDRCCGGCDNGCWN